LHLQVAKLCHEKTLPSLIHSNRLKLCETGRDQLFSKYANDIETVADTAQTENDDAVFNTPLLTDKTNSEDKSHIATFRANGSKTLVPPSATTRGRTTAGGPTTTANAEESSANEKEKITRYSS